MAATMLRHQRAGSTRRRSNGGDVAAGGKVPLPGNGGDVAAATRGEYPSGLPRVAWGAAALTSGHVQIGVRSDLSDMSDKSDDSPRVAGSTRGGNW